MPAASRPRLSLLLALVALGGCGLNTSAPAVELAPGATEVTISDALKSCSVDAECVLVDTGCDACCQQQAINTTQVDRFREEFAEACVSYEGGAVCDCIAAPAEARCVDRRCTLVPLD